MKTSSGASCPFKLDWKHPFRVGRLRFRALSQKPERRLARRIAKLNLGAGPIAIERTEGGISNHNFVVRVGGQDFVARLGEERPLLGIDRRNEVVCHRAASALGLAPAVIHHEAGLLVTRFIAGRTLAQVDVRQPDCILLVASQLRRLHDSWAGLIGEMVYFCPFQTVRTYAQTAAKIGASLPNDIAQVLADAAVLSRQIAPFRPVLCHNDLLAANLINADDRLWLVDWEYAGIGHACFDLANLSANARFTDEQDRGLLTAYHGEFQPGHLTELRIFKAMSLVREALWSTIQTVASDIDFDYYRYAADNLEAYRAARSRLD
ncbi:MAG TPA: phosphotransferase [Isosphaeraceae bacterium]|nr:phosphotransferase [Isosphaeraceae bacterium]